MEVQRKCTFCLKQFETSTHEIARGNGKYCSISCSSKNRKKKPHNCKCPRCGITFRRKPSYLKIRKGKPIFCSKKCYDIAKRIENGWKEIQPSHYGNINNDYRAIAFRAFDKKCNRCGYAKFQEILEVHHIDRNRSNNDQTNLEILCRNCRAEEHFLCREGVWKNGVDG